MTKEKNVSNAILRKITLIFTVAVLMVTCVNLKPLHVNAASKPVSKVYCWSKERQSVKQMLKSQLMVKHTRR